MNGVASAKPYGIAKCTVWEAYQQVNANRGAAGIDDETIDDFEQNLSKKSVQAVEPDVVGVVLPAAGQAGGDSQGIGRHAKAGSAHGR